MLECAYAKNRCCNLGPQSVGGHREADNVMTNRGKRFRSLVMPVDVRSSGGISVERVALCFTGITAHFAEPALEFPYSAGPLPKRGICGGTANGMVSNNGNLRDIQSLLLITEWLTAGPDLKQFEFGLQLFD
jgi:hypothetical protein